MLSGDSSYLGIKSYGHCCQWDVVILSCIVGIPLSDCNPDWLSCWFTSWVIEVVHSMPKVKSVSE